MLTKCEGKPQDLGNSDHADFLKMLIENHKFHWEDIEQVPWKPYFATVGPGGFWAELESPEEQQEHVDKGKQDWYTYKWNRETEGSAMQE